ncbi:MAG: hypothetical protein R3202_13020, partial [Candidatus Competibacterales bacterium]|nr:hypothetical protein [Candidatus Competibacterales bacterium]
RVDQDLLHLTLEGALGLEALNRLETLLERQRARLLRLRLEDRTRLEPEQGELEALAERHSDPLLARVATRLLEQVPDDTEDAAVARVALRELHAALAAGD